MEVNQRNYSPGHSWTLSLLYVPGKMKHISFYTGRETASPKSKGSCSEERMAGTPERTLASRHPAHCEVMAATVMAVTASNVCWTQTAPGAELWCFSYSRIRFQEKAHGMLGIFPLAVFEKNKLAHPGIVLRFTLMGNGISHLFPSVYWSTSVILCTLKKYGEVIWGQWVGP